MNQLSGKVLSIDTQDQLSLVRVEVRDAVLCTIIVNRPEEVPYLDIGKEVQVLFKETEVVIALPECKGISLQNQLLCEVLELQKGALLSRLSLGHPAGKLVSIITSRAIEQLGIGVGSMVKALIKTNEMMLSE